MNTSYIARRGDGQTIPPGEGIVPILHELEVGRLAVVGTGFYITRYGLFLTAAHVFDGAADLEARTLDVMYVLHLAGDDALHLRQVRRLALIKDIDIAVGQADNYVEKYPIDPLMNLRPRLTTDVPATGSRVATYAYPENAVLDFRDPATERNVRSDYYSGQFLRLVEGSDNPFIPYPHFETSIEVRSGASGGPVFDDRGRIVGVNCRGWDFRGSEFEGDNLSSIVPIRSALSFEVEMTFLPRNSWEFHQVPETRRGQSLTIAELVRYGHVLLEQAPGL